MSGVSPESEAFHWYCVTDPTLIVSLVAEAVFDMQFGEIPYWTLPVACELSVDQLTVTFCSTRSVRYG